MLKGTGFRFPSRLEWLFSLKTFIASMIALYIALKLELPRPYWAMASVYVVANPFVGATRSKAVYRAVGTAIGAAAAALLLPRFVEEPLIFSAIVALWSGLLVFASMHDRSARGYLFVLAGYTMPLVALSAVDSPYTVFDIAVSRTEEITVGIICASVVGSILFPVKLSSSLADRASGWFADATKFGQICLSGNDQKADMPTLRRRLVTLSNSLEFVVSQLSYDHVTPLAIKQAQQLISRMQLFVVIGSALIDSLSQLKRENRAIPADLQKAIDLVTQRFENGGSSRNSLRHLRHDVATLARECLAAHAPDSANLAGVFRRLRQFTDVWEDCLTLEAALREPNPSWRGALRHWRVSTPKPYRDTPVLVFSAASAVLAIFVACCLWIYSGWTDGALGVTLAAVSCCFFATADDPAAQITQYFVAVCCSLVIAGIYVVAVLPHTQDFAMLVIIFCVPFVLIGTVLPRPRFAVATALTAVHTATFLSIQGIFDINFDSFLNLNIAGVVGLLFAIIWMRLTKPFGPDLLVARHTRQSWSDIATAASLRPIANQRLFAARVLDRLMQSLQRQTSSGNNKSHPSSESLRDARIVFSVLDLRRKQRRVTQDIQTTLEGVFRNIESYFDTCVRHRHRKPVPAALLASIDNAMSEISFPKSGVASGGRERAKARSEIAFYLADLRVALVRGDNGEVN
ncbi:hypothetical protein AYM40_23100 [Paraburkholderia phytofirmans OLGA172]|uniref:Fusaric acid resistance protein n=1 Tax=Paraburkholderia phytofirmans OLGA172 TaxID=1417228 RepID=A0A160FRB9_9BURK|nr:FUSC family protein [Paraburkholderia phytofirmans]ANB75284.1 hypothetical protein AYM40_23100 [Paraburkholderia phytofirmans OLGA172]